MTPEEFALAHGISLEEATYVLSRRQALAGVPTGSRAELARKVLADAQKRVGVHPVTIHQGVIEVTPDPEADEGRLRFYDADKLRRRLDVQGGIRKAFPTQPLAPEDESQDPGDY